MSRRSQIIFAAIVSLAGCSPTPKAAPPPAAPVAAPPARMLTMVCRNSQDGRTVACGTPNAVMVGVKEK